MKIYVDLVLLLNFLFDLILLFGVGIILRRQTTLKKLILGALKEAVYNGATNMRYIDTVLHEWKKKGYKTMDDVRKNIIKKETEKNDEIFDFDWLNDDEY